MAAVVSHGEMLDWGLLVVAWMTQMKAGMLCAATRIVSPEHRYLERRQAYSALETFEQCWVSALTCVSGCELDSGQHSCRLAEETRGKVNEPIETPKDGLAEVR